MKPAPAALLGSLMLLSGCYHPWPDADSLVSEINCQTSRDAVIALGERFQAHLVGEAADELVQLQKHADAVLVQFDSRQRIVLVAMYRADIRFFGTYRQLASPEVVLDCQTK